MDFDFDDSGDFDPGPSGRTSSFGPQFTMAPIPFDFYNYDNEDNPNIPGVGTTADGTDSYQTMSKADVTKLLDSIGEGSNPSFLDKGITALKGAVPDLLKKYLLDDKGDFTGLAKGVGAGIGGAAILPLLQKLLGGSNDAEAPNNSYVSPFAGTRAAPAAAPNFVQMPSQAQSYQSMLGKGMAQGGAVGMNTGGFVVPADVVSHLGNGSTNAGVSALKKRYPNAHHIQGHGDGMSDDIPATIDGKEPARVADGEVYIEGADNKGLKSLMANVRKARTGTTKQAKAINPARMMKA